AAAATFVESDRLAAERLRETISGLGAERAVIVQADALRWLDGPPERFDIVFLDPPFQSGLLAETFGKLDSGGWLSPAARVYLEAPAKNGPPPLPAGWTLHRSGKAGAVGYHLALR
ncbi:MAG: RsmD family RNA methyltransferase, partial [Steroidobacteraceae bacterium]